MKFTQTNIRNLKATPGKADETIWDENMAGFGIRFRNGGAGVFVIQYFLHGRQGKMVLGKIAQVNLIDAQNEAKQQFAMIARGVDPARERAKNAADNATIFKMQIDPFIAFLESHGRTDSYVEDNRRSLDRRFHALHVRGIKTIERSMVAAELSKIRKEHGDRAAGNCRSHLHKFFNWLIGEGIADLNPVTGTNKGPSRRRDRVLDPDEIVHIWNESGNGDYGKIVKLLILTGARIDSIGSLNRKTELKLDKRLLDLPAHRNKNKERFLIPLSRRALAILAAIPKREKSDFVFGEGEGGFSGWSACKSRLDQRLKGKVEDWVHHDFRRTFDTLGQDICKIPPHVTDVVLNHVGEAKKGVKRNYNYATYLDEKRDAMEKWADYIDGLLNKTPKLQMVS